MLRECVGPTRASQRSVACFNLDNVVPAEAGFEVEHTGPGEVIEASLRLACRCPSSACRGSVTATIGLSNREDPSSIAILSTLDRKCVRSAVNLNFLAELCLAVHRVKQFG